MLSINNISNGLYFCAKGPKSVPEAPICDGNVIEFSKSASDSISNTQRGLMRINPVVPLNKTSEYSKYFGVDCAENIQDKLLNQAALSYLKIREQNIVNFPIFYIDNESDIDIYKKRLSKYTAKFSENSPGRWTISSRFYGKNGESGTHTLGLFKKNNKIYIMDSLSGSNPVTEIHHDILADILGGDVVFSKKNQQKLNEFTCNNWTHANIDAILESVENGTFDGEKIDSILPNDINKILKEQKEYIEEKLAGMSIIEEAGKKYSKK